MTEHRRVQPGNEHADDVLGHQMPTTQDAHEGTLEADDVEGHGVKRRHGADAETAEDDDT